MYFVGRLLTFRAAVTGRKEELAQLRPKYHRSMKVDPNSATAYRMSAKRAIQCALSSRHSRFAVWPDAQSDYEFIVLEI